MQRRHMPFLFNIVPYLGKDSIASVGRRAGVGSPYHFWMVATGKRPFSADMAKAVEAATKGRVKAVWMLGLKNPPKLKVSE